MATDLTFLKRVKVTKMKSSGWTLERAKKLLAFYEECVKENRPITTRDSAAYIGLSKFSITQFHNELTQAAEAGMTLEEYLAAGRPFQPYKKASKKILAS